jgi:hypothetical protein
VFIIKSLHVVPILESLDPLGITRNALSKTIDSSEYEKDCKNTKKMKTQPREYNVKGNLLGSEELAAEKEPTLTFDHLRIQLKALGLSKPLSTSQQMILHALDPASYSVPRQLRDTRPALSQNPSTC